MKRLGNHIVGRTNFFLKKIFATVTQKSVMSIKWHVLTETLTPYKHKYRGEVIYVPRDESIINTDEVYKGLYVINHPFHRGQTLGDGSDTGGIPVHKIKWSRNLYKRLYVFRVFYSYLFTTYLITCFITYLLTDIQSV